MRQLWTIVGRSDAARSLHWYQELLGLSKSPPAHGLLLFFRVNDFDEARDRARRLAPQLAEEPNRNPNSGTMEFPLRDPDGYYVMVSSLTD